METSLNYCETKGCLNHKYKNGQCVQHQPKISIDNSLGYQLDLEAFVGPAKRNADQPMSVKYPKYYKAIPKNWDSIDVYGVCKLFPVNDDTGCIHHAVKKLLVPGTRTGGKSFRDDIKEARDTLTRWLELNPDPKPKE